MLRLRQSVACLVVVCFFVSATGVAQAQSAPVPAPAQQPVAAPVARGASDDTMANGLMEGEALAEAHATSGNLATGLGIGVLTGLIGTGIGYFVVGPSPLSAEAIQRSLSRSADYQLGLKTGWEKKTRERKRHAFLAGGLLGTAVWIVIVASAQSGQ
jgi:hypothetical protein